MHRNASSISEIKNVETHYHRPVIVLLFFFMSGILTGRYLFYIPHFSILAWIIVFTCLAWLIRTGVTTNRPTVFAPLILFFMLGWLVISSQVYPAFPPGKVLPYLDQQPHKISGKVDQVPVKMGFRTRFILTDLNVYEDTESNSPIRLPGKIQLTVYGTSPEILPGYRITTNRAVRSIRNFNNPGGFNYRQYMAYRNIWGTAWDNGDRITIEPLEAQESIFPSVATLRMEIDQAIAFVSQGESRAILSALLIGNRELISPELREAFSRAGVSHLLAISGLHVGIVATVSFFLFSTALGRNTYLSRHAMVKKGAAFLSVWFVLGYGMLAGMSPSTQRAVIMISIFLFAFVLERRHNPMNSLAAAALGILAISPQSLFDISFQLSFTAVSAIFIGLYLFPPAPETVAESLWKRFLRILKGFVCVSVFAIIGTMPIIAYYFNHVTFLGLLANLILVPLIGFIVVPLGLISVLLYPLATPLSLFGFTIADTLLNIAISIIKAISMIPYGSFRVITPSIIELICIYVLLVATPILFLVSRNKSAPPETRSSKNGAHHFSERQRSATKMIAAIAIIVLVCDISYWVHRRFLHSDMTVTFLDVGQGNAALIQIPGGKTMLIDGGGFSDNAGFDVGELIIAPYLWRNKIRTVDKVVLSHPHADHLNGLLYVLENFKVGKVISTHYPANTNNYKKFLEIIENRGIHHPMFSELQREKKINGADLLVHYPAASQIPALAPSNLNNGSIVLQLSYEETSFLFPGDIESAAETELVELVGPLLHSTFLLSPHHGSNTSSTQIFLDAVEPETIIISANRQRYGFPAQQVLERYTHRGYNVFNTEQHGAVRIIVKGSVVKVKPTLGVN